MFVIILSLFDVILSEAKDLFAIFVRVKHWRIIFVLLISFVLSCTPQKESEAYLAPEIVSAEAVVGEKSVSLGCELSAPRAQACGFVYWSEDGARITVNTVLSEASFTSTLTGLQPGQTYQWYAFAKAGDAEVHSQTGSFTVPKPITPDPGPTDGPAGINIPDPYFRRYLLENFDEDGDGVLSEEEALIIRKIDVVTDKISSLKGIEYFKNLDSLICRGADVNEYDNVGYPGLLDSLDVSANHKLRYLACDKNMLRSLNISDNPFLEQVLCSYNLLETIDLSAVPRLRELRMWVNNVSSLDFSNTPLLETLECGGNNITSVDVSRCPRLGTLNIGDLRIKELDLSQCTRLYELKCWDCQLEELNVSMLPRLQVLECSPMSGISGNNLLKKLYVSEDQRIQGVTVDRSTKNIPEETEIVIIKPGTVIIPDPAFKAWLVSRFDVDLDGEISFQEAADIHEIDFWSNLLGVISLRGIEHMPELEILRCPGEWVSTVVLNKEHYYLSKHYHWDECIGPVGTLKQVDVSRNPKLRILDLSNNSGIGETGSGTLDLYHNPLLEELILPMCYIKYPDISRCPALRVINLSHGRGDMPDFSGFGELRLLDVSHDNSGRLQPVDVSGCPYLEELNVDASVSSLSDLRNNPNLKVLRASWCTGVDPDLSAVPLLEEYERISCDLRSLDVSGLRNLKSLTVSDNPLGSLDLSSMTGLERLVCNSCNLTELDVSACPLLRWLICGGNRIRTLDLSHNPHFEGPNGDDITGLYCSPMNDADGNNVLETLYVPKGKNIPGVTENRSTDHVPAGTKIVAK